MMAEKTRLKIISISFGLVLVFCWSGVTDAADWQWIAPQRAYALVREGSGLWLIDVRNREEFERAHAEGSLHMSKEAVPTKRFPRLKVVVIVDDSLGQKDAREAAVQLVRSGQEKIYIMDGGFSAWIAEKLPVAGKSIGRHFRSVSLAELQWAQENNLPLRIFDLRGQEEQSRGRIKNAETMAGKDLQARLEQAAGLLARKGGTPLSLQPEKGAIGILVFPVAADAAAMLEQNARLFPGDVRYLAGGLVAWLFKPDKELKSVDKCPTCPGAAPGGNQ